VKRSTKLSSLLRGVTLVLNEAVMGLLALVALATSVGSLVFEVSPRLDWCLTIVELVVLALFVVEFWCQLVLAQDRSAWLRSPWRIIDAVSILGSLLSFLPWVSDAFRGTLVLRFLRIGRAVAFGTRAGVVAAKRTPIARRVQSTGPEILTVVRPANANERVTEPWNAIVAEARRRETFWCHASSPTAQWLHDLAELVGLPSEELSTIFGPEGRSRRKLSDVTVLSVAMPDTASMVAGPEERCRLLVVVSAQWLITATSTRLDIIESAGPILAGGSVPFSLAATTRVLEILADRYSQVAHECEDELYRLEEMRAAGGEQFLNRAFQLQRHISAASGEIWRLKGLVRSPGESADSLRSALPASSQWLAVLDDVDTLSGRLASLKEEVKSLIELHMNVTSFEMNKFMKLLAIIGFLGLIPSVVGGLLGMNVIDNPWPVTLGQVAFGIAMGMALSLYMFAIKGWLR
jgi:Mg2+ and Co2+ transporter CorA